MLSTNTAISSSAQAAFVKQPLLMNPVVCTWDADTEAEAEQPTPNSLF